MTSADTITVFAWELHLEDGSSDKYYRFLVSLAPEPFAVFVSGRRGRTAAQNVPRVQTAQDVINAAYKMTAAKERKGYQISRDFTAFSFPVAELTGDFKADSSPLGHRFAAAADEQGTALANAASVL